MLVDINHRGDPAAPGPLNEAPRHSRFFYAVARVTAWVTIPLYALGIGSAILLEWLLSLPITLLDMMLVAGFGAFAVVGAVLLARKPDNSVSWIMAAIGLVVAIAPAAETYAAYVMTVYGEPNVVAVLGVWANDVYWIPVLTLAFVYLPLLFPTGRLLSRRWRIPAGITAISALSYAVYAAFRPVLVGQDVPYEILNPIGYAPFTAARGEQLFAVLSFGLLIGVGAGVVSVILRFRRAPAPERLQLKWFLFAVALTPFAFYPWPWVVVADTLIGLALMAPPIAVGIAILRYRLYDIDLIIRKTLIYALLSLLLALVYFASVVVMQSLIGRAATEESPLVIVLSTLFIAALFTPGRRRVQGFIDRRFYRRRYDAEKVLAAFGRSARDEVELEALSAELVRVVQETMGPECASLWLRPADPLPASPLAGSRN